SLYLVAHVMAVEVSYDRCLELLPNTTTGNSMLEFKKALQTLGLKSEAMQLSPAEFVRLRSPTVVYVKPPPKDDPTISQVARLGHFFVSRPTPTGLQLLDYPYETEVISREDYEKYLGSRGLKEIVALVITEPAVLTPAANAATAVPASATGGASPAG